MTEATWCEACENRLPAKHPARDMCLKHPRHEGYGFVRKGKWDDFPPFLFCRDVNGGGCPLFEPKRGEDDEKD